MVKIMSSCHEASAAPFPISVLASWWIDCLALILGFNTFATLKNISSCPNSKSSCLHLLIEDILGQRGISSYKPVIIHVLQLVHGES